MQPDDLACAASLARAQLDPLRDAAWEAQAGDLDWSCRRTLDHIIDTLLLYSSAVARRATGRDQWIPVRNQDPESTIPNLLDALSASAAILDQVCRATADTTRVFHPSGLSNVSGFRAMACSEILTHTDDILLGLHTAWSPSPPTTLCDRILARVFPWAPTADEEADRWEVVRWACGRTALASRPRLDEQWWWHAAPTGEWDGRRNERTAPPAWS
ncbi:MAG: DinB family protein [Thermomicrobiales bacterium]